MIDKTESVEKTAGSSGPHAPASHGASGAAPPPPHRSLAAERVGGVRQEPRHAADTADRPSTSHAESRHDSEETSRRDVGSLLGALGGWSAADDEGDETPSASTADEARRKAEEGQALDDLDRYGDVYDNPGGGDTDGIISTSDLEHVASGDYDREAARERLKSLGVAEVDMDATLQRLSGSAQTLLDSNDLRNRLDVANDFGGRTDGDIARSDLSRELFRRQLEQARSGNLPPGPTAANRDSYAAVDVSNAERTPAVIQAQEAQILEAVASGQRISFHNANGQTEELTVRQVGNTGGKTVYEMTGADGHTVRIESELGASENRTALARMADYYTQVPPQVRQAVDRFELKRQPDETAAATYFSANDRVEFYDGLRHLNEEVFNHEFAHGIGYEKDGLGEGWLDKIGQVVSGSDGEGAPGGWQDAIKSDGQSLSSYADTNHKEDFAESWAAYVEARENGTAALEGYREAFPARFAILEQFFAQQLR